MSAVGKCVKEIELDFYEVPKDIFTSEDAQDDFKVATTGLTSNFRVKEQKNGKPDSKLSRIQIVSADGENTLRVGDILVWESGLFPSVYTKEEFEVLFNVVKEEKEQK